MSDTMRRRLAATLTALQIRVLSAARWSDDNPWRMHWVDYKAAAYLYRHGEDGEHTDVTAVVWPMVDLGWVYFHADDGLFSLTDDGAEVLSAR